MRHLMVVDLGGGTFDVTMMEIFEGTLEILATAGESMLGGEDFTDRLVAEVLRRRGMHVEQTELREPLRVARLRQNCEQAKTMFATHESWKINVPDSKGVRTEDDVEIHRDEFDLLSQPLLERLAMPLQRALRDGNRSSKQIDDVILVGGATRMPCLRQFLIDRLDCQPKMDFNPDQVVALGAAVQAALLADDRAVNDMLLTDVCPHTLGVEVVKRFGQQVLEGYYSPIIHRNTTLPVSQEHVFSTAEPFQQSVRLRVYQGEGRKVRDNQLLGELTIDGFPPQTESVEFIVRFTYDLNGILEVEAIVPLTGKKFRAVLTQSTKGLTQSQIDAAVAEMQKIKFYPRDELENQRLLRYCERLVGEVSPFHRAEFEAAIDYWEQSMSSGNREQYEIAKQGLLTLISQLGLSSTIRPRTLHDGCSRTRLSGTDASTRIGWRCGIFSRHQTKVSSASIPCDCIAARAI